MARFESILKNINKLAFWISFILSIMLIITSFIIPPTGVIDPSVLAATGELFAFGALACVIAAIEKGGKSVTISKGDTSINIDDSDTDSEENLEC